MILLRDGLGKKIVNNNNLLFTFMMVIGIFVEIFPHCNARTAVGYWFSII